jgi:hypothetical protein
LIPCLYSLIGAAQAAGAGLAPVRIPVQLHQLAGEPVDLLDIVGDETGPVEQTAQHSAAGAVKVDQDSPLGAQKLDLLPEVVAAGEGEREGRGSGISHADDSTAAL